MIIMSFCISPIFKCNLNYSMSLLFLITSNIFIYFLILDNFFNINWGPNEITVRFIFWLFAECILIMLTRCICTLKNNSNYNSIDDTSFI
jgi:hypothetical protein